MVRISGDMPNMIQGLAFSPDGRTLATAAMLGAKLWDVAAGSDIDLYVLGPVSGSSGSGTSAEEVNFVNPPAGNYIVYVHGWGLPSGSSPFALHTWVLGGATAGKMTVTAPAAAAIGPGTIDLTFSGLTAGPKYLGSVVYGGASGLPSPTIVRVDP